MLNLWAAFRSLELLKMKCLSLFISSISPQGVLDLDGYVALGASRAANFSREKRELGASRAANFSREKREAEVWPIFLRYQREKRAQRRWVGGGGGGWVVGGGDMY